MAPSINRQLTAVNSGLLHGGTSAVHHKPMVEKMAGRLRQLKGDMSLAAFGEIAGVSSTSAMKWLKGGNVKDEHLEKIAAHFRDRGITVHWLRYGGRVGEESELDNFSPLALDVAKRWMALSPDRQEWFRDLIFTMSFVEERFPAMRKGRPRGEHYTALERAIERDMRQLKLNLEP